MVGRDSIEPEDGLLRLLGRAGVDVAQARGYIEQNRHNQVTAHYYLLKIKAERDPTIKAEVEGAVEERKKTGEKVRERREESPIIYRPEGRQDYFIPGRRAAGREKDTPKNDSMNVSNIITSLVEANKGRIVTGQGRTNPKKDNFDKVEDFKLFPNKKNSSIYEPSPSRGTSTKRSEGDERSFNQSKEKSNSIDRRNISINSSSLEGPREETVSKRRQELSDQLKQISLKIDKEILELRKQHNGEEKSKTNSIGKQRESLGGYSNQRVRTTENSLTNKHPTRRDSTSRERESFNAPRESSYSSSKEKAGYPKGNSTQPAPKVHAGPFNAHCVFLENARALFERVGAALGKMNLRYIEAEPYHLSVGGGPNICIENVQGISGLHLVKFLKEHPANKAILEVLAP